MHVELEQQVARFLGKEDCVVFNMGYGTNATTIPALCSAVSFVFRVFRTTPSSPCTKSTLFLLETYVFVLHEVCMFRSKPSCCLVLWVVSFVLLLYILCEGRCWFASVGYVFL